jgi:hypothetical protein
MLGRVGRGFGRLGLVGGKHGPPAWVPLLGSTQPTLYADFTTEGAGNRYWYNGAQYGSEAAWLTALNGTFANASTRYYTNSSGRLATAAANVLRFDYDPVSIGTSKGILLEGASTNVLLRSNTFNNSGVWTFNSGGSVSQDATGPDGVANSAWTYTIGGAGDELYQQTSQANGTWTLSRYVKKSGTSNFPWLCLEQTVGGTDYAFAVFNLGVSSTATQTGVGGGAGASVVSTSAVSVGNGWYRISLTASITPRYYMVSLAQAATGTTVTSGGDITNAAASDTLQIWESQAEQLSFASSQISTTTVAVTRAADTLIIPLSAASTLTAVAKVTAMEGFTSDGRVIGVGSGKFLDQSASTTVKTDNGTNNITATTNAWTATNKVGVTGTGATRSIAANNGAATTDANALLSGAITNLYVMADNAANPSYGDLASIAVWNGVSATGAQLTALTL